ncbi:hypothetical protein [Oryza sativa Japonica Group]|uniref:Uncharacterized protein n=1 Tax=Oryza sativa subsp. japonica TaxID=39947 RepID=Q5JMP0_ORYSJ|nr:hypothetical protein [Oryza sativa Japonica Group]
MVAGAKQGKGLVAGRPGLRCHVDAFRHRRGRGGGTVGAVDKRATLLPEGGGEDSSEEGGAGSPEPPVTPEKLIPKMILFWGARVTGAVVQQDGAREASAVLLPQWRIGGGRWRWEGEVGIGFRGRAWEAADQRWVADKGGRRGGAVGLAAGGGPVMVAGAKRGKGEEAGRPGPRRRGQGGSTVGKVEKRANLLPEGGGEDSSEEGGVGSPEPLVVAAPLPRTENSDGLLDFSQFDPFE